MPYFQLEDSKRDLATVSAKVAKLETKLKEKEDKEEREQKLVNVKKALAAKILAAKIQALTSQATQARAMRVWMSVVMNEKVSILTEMYRSENISYFFQSVGLKHVCLSQPRACDADYWFTI